jgi:putative endonuclease
LLKSDPATWSDPRHRLGEAAERRVARLLARAGYRVLEQRFRLHHHDVDLVARAGSVVVFVEVKARAGPGHGRAAEAVTARKQHALARAAEAWLQRWGRRGDVARFDVVTVEAGRVHWVQDAFRPGWR